MLYRYGGYPLHIKLLSELEGKGGEPFVESHGLPRDRRSSLGVNVLGEGVRAASEHDARKSDRALRQGSHHVVTLPVSGSLPRPVSFWAGAACAAGSRHPCNSSEKGVAPLFRPLPGRRLRHRDLLADPWILPNSRV